MGSATTVHRCPHCAGERLYKNGHTVRGAQRAKRKDCRRTFTLVPKGPRHSPALKAQVLAACADRMSLRGVHRTFGVCYQTVTKWLGEKKKRRCPPFRTRSCPAKKATCLNLGELWSFVGKKANACWRWVALCRRTRQIVAWTAGDRSASSACALRTCLPRDYLCRATRSDLWEAYAGAFPARTHRSCGKAAGETCHVERFFGTLRACLGRLVRRAHSFSKDLDRHLEAIHLFILHHNLQIKHAATSN